MLVKINEYPKDKDWFEVKKRALVTVGKKAITEPNEMWKRQMLLARHSPIRRLNFSFYIECPYWVSVHLCRHIHAQPYVKSQRNDRQNEYNRDFAPQGQEVCMIWDMNAEELMTIANKRLCKKASTETREIVEKMCELVIEKMPEFDGLLVPNCKYHGGVCHEMQPCYNET